MLYHNNNILVHDIRVPQTAAGKMKGLLLIKQPPDYAMVFKGVRMIHTFGMAFPIDVIYLDKQNQVLWVGTIQPNRFGPYYMRAQTVIEAKQGTFSKVSKGDTVEVHY